MASTSGDKNGNGKKPKKDTDLEDPSEFEMELAELEDDDEMFSQESIGLFDQ